MAADPVFARDLTVSAPIGKLFSLITLVCAVLWPLPTFFLWWLPRKIGMSYTTVFFSWMPHRPADERERYKLARFWRLPGIPRYAVQSMTHHAVHHLAMARIIATSPEAGGLSASDLPEGFGRAPSTLRHDAAEAKGGG